MTITEDNVVSELQQRNEKAIAFIIQQYGGLIAAIIKRHVNHEHQDYEECLDDVLLAVWHHIDDFNPEINEFKQWLAAIAKYKAIDCLRKRIRVRTKELTVADIDDSMAMAGGLRETALTVDELLEALTAQERTIFENYYLIGTPSSEIAKQYNSKESWVHNKLSRGRKKLRKIWIDYNGGGKGV
ncbi:sigma-70 family RNA polymerase sigma factor [Paenibacillus sp. MMS18-CY102]|uniref:sigma-70 family RNA polymerase sigma factor n=1 Tax=Paenibacillus sp. MMS18-CY102 TaxID=2682849 RepID=UPI001365B578|nr:sigma-70 family RNA polymerase sigma factor [Paenibacillus sp. MMS18-CY102]MWC30957.1 sigma-70 family RNA polymerase sigma factor [Paenibacillus sp. MMS18-CY102]